MTRNGRQHQQGFNLIELIVMTMVIAILAGIAMPSINSVLDRQAVKAEASKLLRSINLARSNAVNNGQGLDAGVASSSGTADDWSAGWRVFVDGNSNGGFDAAEELLYEIVIEGRALSVVSSGFDSIIFDRQGRADAAGLLYLAVCDAEHSDRFEGSRIVLRPSGTPNIEVIPRDQKATRCADPST